MADAPASPRKRKTFTRTPKPIFGVLRISDGNGGYLDITKEQVELVIERDTERLLEAVSNGNVGGVVLRINIPQSNRSPAA